MRLVDTHLHIIDRKRLSYPWLSGVPALNRDFSYREYERQALRAGISDALHMEVDVAPDDIEAETSFVHELAKTPGNMIRGVLSACRPEESGFASMLERQLADSFVKGYRRLINPLADGVSESPAFVENIRRLAGTRMTFDLHVHAHQMERAMRLADAAPGVSFILDHCGVPDVKGGDIGAWRRGITEIARRPHVAGKISGVAAYGDPETWTADTLRPYVEHMIESFGWDRVVWGSDWPVCTLGGGLLHWIAATQAILSGSSKEEREKLLWQNANRLWNLGLDAASPHAGESATPQSP